MTENPIKATSDLPREEYVFLEEPTLPKLTDFKQPENYEFALNEYKHKLEVYQARLSLVKAEQKITETEEKSPFKCMLGKHYPSYNDFILETDEGEKLPFKPGSVAKWIRENEPFKTDLKTGILYYYNGKSWIADAEPYLEKIVSIMLGEENKQNHFNNILHDLKGLSYEDIVFSRKITVENGLLDLENINFELTAFSQEEMPFHSLPVTYDKDAETGRNSLNK